MADIYFNEFVWDSDKEAVNILIHNGITFIHATECFEDDLPLIFEDLGNFDEQRFKIFARDFQDDILTIVYTQWQNGDIIRLISARYAEPFEVRIYENTRR